jgi:hypothetical protein
MKHFNTSLKAFTIKTSKTINAITTALHKQSKKTTTSTSTSSKQEHECNQSWQNVQTSESCD